MSKKDARLVKSCDEFKGVLTWNFNPVDGKTPAPIEFNVGPVWEELNKLHPVAAQAMMHGYKQKISDAGAMSRDTETGKADPMARVAKMRRMADTLAGDTATGRAPQWELDRQGGGAGPGLLARAIAEAIGKDIDTVREWLKGKSTAERTALRMAGNIKPIYDRLEAESAKTVDAEDLLAGLE